MKKLLLIIFIYIISLSQEFDFSKNYNFKTKEDYTIYQSDFLLGLKYLEETPFNENIQKRKFIYTVLLKWLTGTPTVHLTIQSYMMKFSQKNPDFLIILLGNMAKYEIENPNSVDNFQKQLSGLKAVLSVYKKDDGVNSDDFIDEIIDLENDDKLEEWLKTQLEHKE